MSKPPAISVQIFLRLIAARGLPAPVPEHRFHPVRKWRMDHAWLDERVFLEVQGGMFSGGRHMRGASVRKEWEKINTASGMGWRVLYCAPESLNLLATIDQIEAALKYNPSPAARCQP